MKDVLITSSVLILAILALRAVFRKTISRQVQYALWGLVLLRLLVPVSLPALQHNVLTAAEPAAATVSRQLEQRKVYVLPTGQVDLPEESRRNPELQPGYEMAPTSTGVMVVDDGGETATVYVGWITGGEALRCVWYGGMAVMACWFLVSNLRFWRKIHQARVPYSVENCRYSVYLVENGLPSPCLFGLFRPAIYLTPAALASPDSLRHVIAHETTHARHLDSLWSLLRCLCLTVYWFDPLVWAAALVSRTDCELACDEGALRRLGEAERIPYGRTLLALVPVRRTPADPLLSATTMTAGKRQLKDRITRIAENQQTVSAALFLVLALAALACVATFTGAKSGEAAAEAVLLTAEELEQFSQDFSGPYHSIRSQFLSSVYERPEDIDMAQLFYNGTGLPGAMGEEERQQVVDTFCGGEDPGLDLIKLPAWDVDAVLKQYTGLTLEQTQALGMGAFHYLADYDAYYAFHGDTNARGGVVFSLGVRQGDLVRLYYDDTDFDFTGWKCVTLREYPGEPVDGFPYYFVSNLLRDPPPEAVTVSSTVYPDWEPELTISLDGTPAVDIPDAEITLGTNDCAEVLKSQVLSGLYSVCFYKSADGNTYAALHVTDTDTWTALRFRTIGYDVWPEVLSIHPFTNVLGCDGFAVSYQTMMGTWTTEYYALEENDSNPLRPSLRLLFQNTGTVTALDWDGDGQQELLWEPIAPEEGEEGPFLYFLRDGQIHRANLWARVADAWDQLDWWDYSYPDTEARCLVFRGFLDAPEWPDNSQPYFRRYLYFDGERLLLYKDHRQTVDHMLEGVSGADYAVDAAKAHVQEKLAWWQSHSGGQSYIDGEWRDTGEPAEWDDWRITALEYLPVRSISSQRPEVQAEVYSLGYELHTATPEKVLLAGGMNMDEDNWVGGFYDEDCYLVFLTDKDGGRTLLKSCIDPVVSWDAPMFSAGVAETLAAAGALRFSEINPEFLALMFYDRGTWFLNELGKSDAQEQVKALRTLMSYRNTAGSGMAYLIDDPMEALHWNQNGLTEEGLAAYARLKDIYSSETGQTPGDLAQEVMDAVVASGQVTLSLTTADSEQGRNQGGTYTVDADRGNGPNRALGFGSGFQWSVSGDTDLPVGAGASFLTVSSPDGGASIQCWDGSDTVLCTIHGVRTLLSARAEQENDVFDVSVFAYLRLWFDEAEWAALTGGIVIPDRGQSHQEIAQAWVDARNAVRFQVTQGSGCAYSYVRSVAREAERIPETAYPENTVGRERFYFEYDTVFVPANQTALMYGMAGNTGDYAGQYGEAPEGAFMYNRIGPMYLTEQGWRCDGVGTGP